MDCEKYVPRGSFYRGALGPLLLHVPLLLPRAGVGDAVLLPRARAGSSAGSAALA